MKVKVIFELASDGGCGCFMADEVPGIGLTGYGDNPRLAKEDFLEGYEEMKKYLAETGQPIPELEFEYHYDMQSFFQYFSFLNVSKIAELAHINPSLMRKYTAGIAQAGEGQYQKLRLAVQTVADELAAAHF